MLMVKTLEVQKLGLVPCQEAWALQDRLAERIAGENQPETLLLLEHPHTYTLGRRGHAENILWSQEQLDAKGVKVVWVDRGGDITYHGPGQLVGYPLLRLAPIGWHGSRLPQVDYVGYIRKLETVLIETLKNFGISAIRVCGKTGVWADPKGVGGLEKIASIGVKVDSRGISRHGFALNVDPDMSYWEGIVPCGLEGVRMTSMRQILSATVANKELIDVLIHRFGKAFQRRVSFKR